MAEGAVEGDRRGRAAGRRGARSRARGPLPGTSDRDSRSNSLKIRSWSAGSIPGPASCTVSQASAPSCFSADHDLRAGRILQRVDDQVLRDLAQQHRIARTTADDITKRRSMPRAAASGCRSIARRWKSRPIATGAGIRLERLAVEAGDVEERADQLLGALERGGDPLDEIGLDGVDRELAELADQEPPGAQRLQQVVARRAQEARLGAVGLVGRLARRRELGVAGAELGQRPLEVGVARDDLALEHRRGPRQRVGGAADVVEPLEPLDQRLVDPRRASRSAAARRQSAGAFRASGSRKARPTKVWLTCSPPCCSP